MPELAGKHALLQMFQAEGVKYIFGNPGTSETPMMTILPEYPDLEYLLVLQEGVAVGMAEVTAGAQALCRWCLSISTMAWPTLSQ